MTMWVRRDEAGKIEGAAFAYQKGFEEEVADNHVELRAFITGTLPKDPAAQDTGKALIERRARALERKGDQLGAIVLRTGG